jgi:hypothetical protein
LAIEPGEVDTQSFQSVTLDTSRHREMVDLVEKQRSHANRVKDRLHKPSHDAQFDHPMPHLERQVTTSTEGLSDITFESDDGIGSDRTTTACKSFSTRFKLLFMV